MLGSFMTTAARTVTSRVAGIVIETLVEAGEDALINAAGPFGGIVRNFLSDAGASNINIARHQQRFNNVEDAMTRRANAWRHDWRSQPRQPAGRPEGGEWMPGRLTYMAEIKAPLSRNQRQRRAQALRAYKQRRAALGETKTRTIRSSFGTF